MKQKKERQHKQNEMSEQQRIKQRRKQFLLIGVITLLFMLLAAYKDKQNSILNEDKNLLRKEPGTGSQEIQMDLEIPGLDETVPYSLRVGEREYTYKEREELFQNAQDEIDQKFPSKGESVNHISKQVHLPETLAGGMIRADWSFSDSKAFGSDGTIQADYVSEKGTLVQVQVTMSYKSYECLYEFPCMVYPEKIEDKEALLRRVGQVITKNSQQNQDETEQILPKKIGRYDLVWRLPKAYTPIVILLLGIASIAVILFLEKEQKKKKEELRKKQMQMEYPQLVSKLALLLGAGMSVKQAWERICDGYGNQLERGNCKRSELYEQMQTTYRQMQDGLGESRAYEQFGERSGMSMYRRFAMLLVQNLKKGNAGLLVAMETEADRAFEERKNNAKRLGEEAGTKLLFPMMIMMAIVIAIVMVPAVMTMQI
jgi:hypothetical protein